MKKQKSTIEQHFTRKEMQQIADFLNMLVEKGIWMFSTDVNKDKVIFKYKSDYAPKK